MNAKDKLIEGDFITEGVEYSKYSKHLDKIFDAVIDYGYVNRIVPEQMNNPNNGRKDTEEFVAFRVKKESKKEFEDAMKDLNIYLSEERLKQDGTEKEFYMFKSKNVPELRQIIRGSVKIKKQEAANAMITRKSRDY